MDVMQLSSGKKVLVAKATKAVLRQFPIVGNAIVVSEEVVRNDFFTTALVYQVEEIYTESLNPEVFTNEIPGLEDTFSDLERYDENGVIRPGQIVRFDTVLAGKGVVTHTLNAEERMVLAIFNHDKSNELRDFSPRWQYQDEGMVVSTNVYPKYAYLCPDCGREKVSSVKIKNLECLYCSHATMEHQGPSQMVSGNQGLVLRIEVLVRRELRVGDVLCDNQDHRFTVAEIVPMHKMPEYGLDDQKCVPHVLVHPDTEIVPLHQHDLLQAQKPAINKTYRPRSSETEADFVTLRNVIERIEDKYTSHSTGLYSLVTHMPLVIGAQHPVKIDWPLIKALARSGYVGNIQESLSVKADTAQHLETFQAVTFGTDPSLGMPESAFLLVAHLRSIGLWPTFLTDQDEEIEWESLITDEEVKSVTPWLSKMPRPSGKPIALKLRPITNEDILNISCGRVRNPETINSKTMAPEPGGLFCERIFGPVNDFSCQCGRYNKQKFKGVVCERCGVEVTDSNVRYRRFGHIELSKAIKHPFGGPDLSNLLVLPAGLRPMVRMTDIKFATADVNDLYRSVVNRNNRLSKIMELNANSLIIDHEFEILARGIDHLFFNDELPEPIFGSRNRPLLSLSTELRSSLWRLFDRRNDYSAHGVVVPDSNIATDAVSIPYRLAVGLYHDHMIGRLRTPTLKLQTLNKLIREDPMDDRFIRSLAEILSQDELKLIVAKHDRFVPLKPVVVLNEDEETIRLHPDTAAKLDLKFNGDAVNLYLPITNRAKAELNDSNQLKPISDKWSLALSLDDIRQAVASGEPISLQPLDLIALGLF